MSNPTTFHTLIADIRTMSSGDAYDQYLKAVAAINAPLESFTIETSPVFILMEDFVPALIGPFDNTQLAIEHLSAIHGICDRGARLQAIFPVGSTRLFHLLRSLIMVRTPHQDIEGYEMVRDVQI